MKILALELEAPGAAPERFQPYLKAEALRVWELHQAGSIRELYFRADQHTAVLVLECDSLEAARELLGSLPLVEAGLITFELIPLTAYPGFARLFAPLSDAYEPTT
jgi:muconolactone delta-isomerase